MNSMDYFLHLFSVQEERRLQQRLNARSIISFEVDATDVFDTLYDEEDLDDYEDDRCALELSLFVSF